jgi:hypothetical protein
MSTVSSSNKKLWVSWLVLMIMLTIATFTMALADDGHKWMESAPSFCRSKPYSNLTPRQMSMCDEAAFRYLSKNWKTITASNGQAYEVALDTIVRPLPDNSDPRATLRSASVLVYMSEGSTFNHDNVLHFYFDCHDRFQTHSSGSYSSWSPTAYAPPLSIAAKISFLACKHGITRKKQTNLPSTTIEKSYEPIPPAWNIKIGLPGILLVGAQYCTQSGKCESVGNDIVGLTIGGTAVGGIQGCQAMPDTEPCLKARIPVEVLAMSPRGSVIVRLHEKNYGVGGQSVYILYKGVSMPLDLYLKQILKLVCMSGQCFEIQ